jgi:Na+/H+ antiporter NhaD/arsenite permease-like protein
MLSGWSNFFITTGAARQNGSRLGFRNWLGYGLPTVGLQLLVAWLWCWLGS